MKTDDLIRRLATESARRRRWSLEARLAVAAIRGLAIVLAMVLAGLGIRPDFGGTLSTPTGALKVVGAIAIAAAAFRVACRLARPGTPALCPLSAAFISVLAAATAIAFASSGAGLRLGVPLSFVLSCTEKIFLLALLPLVAALVALRAGAPTHPTAAGAVAGLLAGGLAAAGFAVSCPMDDPGFVVVGYGAAILLLSAIGALAGRRLLA